MILHFFIYVEFYRFTNLKELPIEVDLINFLQLRFLCKFEKEVSYLLNFYDNYKTTIVR